MAEVVRRDPEDVKREERLEKLMKEISEARRAVWEARNQLEQLEGRLVEELVRQGNLWAVRPRYERLKSRW